MMLDWFTPLLRQIPGSDLENWLVTLPAELQRWYNHRHGEFDKWARLLQKLPNIDMAAVDFEQGVTLTAQPGITPHLQKQLRGLLQQFKPWRKGPFDLAGVAIDTEWRSDWKWDRVKPHIGSLRKQSVLDVGCGNGYHLWRMLADEPELVIGIDPTDLFLIQFQAIKHYHPDPRVHLLPLGIEHMPNLPAFDTVFSMGVLYHRKSPFDFLQQLKNLIKPGGQLVLETLVVEGDVNTVLVPGERYAQMRNVWFIPSVEALEHWLARAGFKNIRTVDVNFTGLDEQRRSDWMDSHSLADFLNPKDPGKTIEGYPAPCRAVSIAQT